MDVMCCISIRSKNVSCSKFTCRHVYAIDKSSLVVAETVSNEALWAAACLRVRTNSSNCTHDHNMGLVKSEFQALKDRIAGKRKGFNRVSCINASLPFSLLDDLCSSCKYVENGEDRVVVGTLDLNQCIKLQDEVMGMKPEGTGADLGRAYLSNVCVTKELQRNGLGSSIIAKSKIVAQQWGITDLYVHVDVANEPAKQFYMKNGFTYESDEPALLARFLDRPRRVLLWHGLPTQNM